jgi:hypothetical protein
MQILIRHFLVHYRLGCMVAFLMAAMPAWSVEPLTIDVTPAAGTVLTSGNGYRLTVDIPGETGEVQLMVGGKATDGTTPYRIFRLNGVAPFELDLMVPWEETGPMKLLVWAEVSDPVSGEIVKEGEVHHELIAKPSPDEVPASIDFASLGGTYSLAAPSEGEVAETLALRPIAVYADWRQREITWGTVGTTYTSSDSSIAMVDADGKVTAVAPGTAFIAVNYLGVRNWAKISVKDAATGRPAISEYTGQVVINRGGFRRDPASGLFVQEVSFTNTTEWPIPRPINLVVADLTPGVTMPENRSLTRYVQPVGSPREYVDFPAATSFLVPGATASATLKFRNNDNLPITYTLRLFGGARP